MKPKQLKLYQKYKHINFPNKEFYYIGIDYEDGEHWFIYQEECDLTFDTLELYGFNPHEICNNLKIKPYEDEEYGLVIINHFYEYFSEEDLNEFKPCLKDKLKNLINR